MRNCGCVADDCAHYQAGRVTAVYVTHDQAEAVVLGDRIGVMRDGKLLQMASRTRSIIVRPTCSWLISLVRRACSRAASSSATRVRHHRRRRVSPHGADAANVKPVNAVKIAVRPENVRLDAPSGTEPNNRFTARVAGTAVSRHADHL